MKIWMASIGLAAVAALLGASGADAAGGEANNYLQSLSPAAQASTLGKAAGPGCTGRSAFFMGIGIPGHPKRQAFWSVKCANGSAFVIQVNPNGAVQSVECTVFLAMDGFPCFKKMLQKPAK